jgi:hypothetical protein
MPLHEWRVHGSFVVTQCTKNSITLRTSGVEIGTGLLADVEYLLDHAAEQRATLRNFVSEPNWCSPAWSIVTVYYWAFFCAMAITRLTGSTTWFLNRAALRDLRQLAGSDTQPGAGALNLNIGSYVSATDREITLRPSRAQLHDSLWIRFHGLVGELFHHADSSANPLEFRLMWCLNEARNRLGEHWPSEIRNLVNYRPGCGYREVIRATEIDVGSYIRRNSLFTTDKLISKFEDELIKVKADAPIIDQIPILCRVLLLFAFTLASVAEELHLELMDRDSADQRWSLMRRRFLQVHCRTDDNRMFWPFAKEL